MIERRDANRRVGIDRRLGKDRRINESVDTQWLRPYGRRKLDTSDSRQSERRELDRRLTH